LADRIRGRVGEGANRGKGDGATLEEVANLSCPEIGLQKK